MSDFDSRLAKAIQESARRGEIVSGFVSKHMGGAPMNENNFGIGYRHPEGWIGGAYKNSLGKGSVYAGKEWSAPLFGDVEAGVMAGGVTGYGRPVTPVLLPQLLYRMGDRAVAATVVPPVGKAPATFAIQMRKKL